MVNYNSQVLLRKILLIINSTNGRKLLEYSLEVKKIISIRYEAYFGQHTFRMSCFFESLSKSLIFETLISLKKNLASIQKSVMKISNICIVNY